MKKKKLSDLLRKKIRFFIGLILGMCLIGALPVIIMVFKPELFEALSITSHHIEIYTIGIMILIAVIVIFVLFPLGVCRDLISGYEKKNVERADKISNLSSNLQELAQFSVSQRALKAKMVRLQQEIEKQKKQSLKKPWIYRFFAKKFGYVDG